MTSTADNATATSGGGWSRVVQLGFALGLLGLWWLTTSFGRVSPLLLPPPDLVWLHLKSTLASGAFWPDLRITLMEFVLAASIATVLGITTGFMIARSPAATAVLEPLLAGLYAIPVILLLPLYILSFGLGPPSKIAIGATIGFFPIALNTITGIAGVDPVHVKAARAMGASRWGLFRHVLLPAAQPVVMAGLRISFTVTLLSIIGSESIASVGGLGHAIVEHAEAMDTAIMYAYVAIAITLAVSLNIALSMLSALSARRV